MTIGENIQKYRKSIGFSQEELGQKLFVSRQTVSLWEKDQTTPTIDNLMRLKEIFGVSVDEILGVESQIDAAKISLNEEYRLKLSEDEVKNIRRLQGRTLYNGAFIFALAAVILILIFAFSAASDLLTGFALGILFIGSVSHIKVICRYNKSWKRSFGKICKSVYEYRVYDEYMMIDIYRNGEKISESKCYFNDIEQIHQYDNWLFLQIGGQLYVLRKRELKENSAFYSFMYKNPLKTKASAMPGKWRAISIILFVASLLSLNGALILVGAVSNANNLFIENMWLFFLMTPIPISSIILGFVLKSKGYKYKKNIVAGIIMTFFLCLYGSFTFMF